LRSAHQEDPKHKKIEFKKKQKLNFLKIQVDRISRRSCMNESSEYNNCDEKTLWLIHRCYSYHGN